MMQTSFGRYTYIQPDCALLHRSRRLPPPSQSALSQAEQLHHWQANRRKLVRCSMALSLSVLPPLRNPAVQLKASSLCCNEPGVRSIWASLDCVCLLSGLWSLQLRC